MTENDKEFVEEQEAETQEAETIEEPLAEEQTAEEPALEEELSETEQLQKKIDELTAELAEEESKRLRVLADMENVKRRASLDYQTLQTYRAQSLMAGILPVLDNFERALSVEVKESESQSLLTGMEMVHRALVDALKAEGLEEIPALDEPFDPNFHQAVMTGQDEEKESGTVLEELQKGYKLKDRVLRPSMVKVND